MTSSSPPSECHCLLDLEVRAPTSAATHISSHLIHPISYLLALCRFEMARPEETQKAGKRLQTPVIPQFTARDYSSFFLAGALCAT